MKLYIANDSKQGLGGGFSFLNNLKKGLKDKLEIVDTIKLCDIFFIPSVSMVTKETFREAWDLNKKIITRVDNVPRNSRNRNTGTSRLLEYCQKSTEIVWQSIWAKDYLIDFIPREGEIIYNGIDFDVFKPEGSTLDFHNEKKDTYLYTRYSRDETKMWEVAWYDFQMIARKNKKAKLVIVGQFSENIMQYNFDFFRGENIEYLGVIDDPERMARVMRSCGHLFAVYNNDAFSNTYLEALAVGMNFVSIDFSGGTTEMLKRLDLKGIEYFSLERMTKDYLSLFEQVLNK